MEETFDLPVEYNGREHVFEAALLVTGFTHKFSVHINGQVVIFEPDEERNYRAVVENGVAETQQNINISLLKAIAEAIEKLVK